MSLQEFEARFSGVETDEIVEHFKDLLPEFYEDTQILILARINTCKSEPDQRRRAVLAELWDRYAFEAAEQIVRDDVARKTATRA
mgnify:CR=1 FL=1